MPEKSILAEFLNTEAGLVTLVAAAASVLKVIVVVAFSARPEIDTTDKLMFAK